MAGTYSNAPSNESRNWNTGACYRAANWVEIGETSGRGRDDRQHRRHGARPKRVFVYPLRRGAQERLRGENGRP